MMRPLLTALLLALIATAPVQARTHDGLADATVLIIRHAEKPPHGRGLDARGVQRAQLYVDYFEHLRVDGHTLRPTRLIATADTAHSERPRLTLTPLAMAMHLPLDTRWRNDQVHVLVHALQAGPPQHVVLICWHHGRIPALLRAFGQTPAALLPHGRWPQQRFDWLLLLRFDAHGRLLASESRRRVEHLFGMPRASAAPDPLRTP